MSACVQSVHSLKSSLVDDATIQLCSFQVHCGMCQKKWGLTDNEMCDCGDIRTVSHIVNSCLLTIFDGGIQRLLTADKAAVDWLTLYST